MFEVRVYRWNEVRWKVLLDKPCVSLPQGGKRYLRLGKFESYKLTALSYQPDMWLQSVVMEPITL